MSHMWQHRPPPKHNGRHRDVPSQETDNTHTADRAHRPSSCADVHVGRLWNNRVATEAARRTVFPGRWERLRLRIPGGPLERHLEIARTESPLEYQRRHESSHQRDVHAEPAGDQLTRRRPRRQHSRWIRTSRQSLGYIGTFEYRRLLIFSRGFDIIDPNAILCVSIAATARPCGVDWTCHF